MNKPDPNTYWVLPGKLLAGEYPGGLDADEARARVQCFIQGGVSYFIDLTQPYELAPYKAFVEGEKTPNGTPCVYRNFPIPDFGVSEIARMREILASIEAALADGRTVYLHCWGGVGRTGTVVGCFLVERGDEGDEALASVERLFADMEKASRRPHSPETDEQRGYIRRWVDHRKA